MRDTNSVLPPHADGGPPNVIVAVSILAGGVMLALLIVPLTVAVPNRAADNRRLREMVDVDALVVEHRDQRGTRTSKRGSVRVAVMQRQIRVEYAVGGAKQSVWITHSAQQFRGDPPTPEPAPPRPAVGSIYRVWYHPDSPDQPTATEPRPLELFWFALLVGVWESVFVVVGACGLLVAVGRLTRRRT